MDTLRSPLLDARMCAKTTQLHAIEALLDAVTSPVPLNVELADRQK